jgi:alpha-L-fucosidase 2
VLALILCTPQCTVPAAQNPAGNYIVPGVLGDVAYGHDLALDAYAPKGEPRPAAVIIHGGQGNKRAHVTQLFEVLDRAGYAWFSVDYHTAADVTEAIRYVRCRGRFNITNQLVLIGADTGAQIALDLAAQEEFHGVVTLGAKLSPGAFAEMRSPLPAGATPVLMFHGTDDDEYPADKAETVCRRLSKCSFYSVPGAIHDFENWHPDQWSWKEDLNAWLRGDRRGLWKDITYARAGGLPLLMDAYLPEGAGPFPAVILVHGGGWEAGDKVTYVSPVFEPLARAGIAWFSIDYRLTPYVRVPQQLDDIRAAIRYVRAHAERFHIDPNRIALLGESASGHLVSQVASMPCPDCSVRAVASFYGVYSFTPWSQAPEGWQRSALKRLFGEWSPDMLREYSPIEHVRADLPPTLLVQGTKDELYQGTLEYAARLKEAGARYELLLLEGAPHGMENWEGHPEWAYYKQKLVEWLLAAFSGS